MSFWVAHADAMQLLQSIDMGQVFAYFWWELLNEMAILFKIEYAY